MYIYVYVYMHMSTYSLNGGDPERLPFAFDVLMFDGEKTMEKKHRKNDENSRHIPTSSFLHCSLNVVVDP